MISFAALTYGVLASFVLSSLGRDHADQKPSPKIVLHMGYLLCGVSAGTAAVLTGAAASYLLP